MGGAGGLRWGVVRCKLCLGCHGGRGQPLALAVSLAAAAGLSLAMTVLVDVRRCRHKFAVLKALGMTRHQVWAAVAWQTTLTLLIAGLLALVAAGNLLASVPATIAARTRAALFLRAESPR